MSLMWGQMRSMGVQCLRASAIKVHFPSFFFLRQLVPIMANHSQYVALNIEAWTPMISSTVSYIGPFFILFFFNILYVCLYSMEGKGVGFFFSKVGQKERCPAAGVIQTLLCKSSANVSKGAKVLLLKNMTPFLRGIIRGVAESQHEFSLFLMGWVCFRASALKGSV